MAKQYPELDKKLTQFIQNQKMFFTGTAAADGRVNVSPKGMDSLRVLSPNRVVWLNLTGSGNETAAHVLEHDRMTLMFCAFEGEPMILRLYGHARAFHPRDNEWDELLKLFPHTDGARQLFDMQLDLVQTSCGFAVPFYEYQQERETLQNWATKKGADGVREYWQYKNRVSIDGKPTGIISE